LTLPMRVALLVVLALGVAAALLPVAGRILVVADPLPTSADAIVVLAGSIRDRALEAAALYRDGIAPRVVVTRETLAPGTTALAASGVELPESDALTRSALIGLGVPPRAIVTLRRRAQSTASEARTIARWACTHGVHRLVVVTSPTHTRRARAILSRTLGPDVTLTVRPARADHFAGRRWMHVRRDAKLVLSEWQKLVNHWLVERWQLRSCGGLRRRAAAAQADFAAAATSAASSPLACISRTMSQPPTNFPPTNTCGMVGHFVYALTASRLSASARMSTALYGTPSSFSTSIVAAEKPHIGNRGVPFM
jgi:uncharacterized SAM-binding protein YcdF (DUF218 family)